MPRALSLRAEMESVAFTAGDKATRYRELAPQLAALFDGEPDLVANLANATAAVRACVPKASWVGFYVRKGDELVLGPFQGNVACVRIAIGRGVCGTAAATRETQLVRDVHEFEGHIACDSASNSEIVVPLVAKDGSLLGVFDIDSPTVARFDEQDRRGMEALAKVFMESIEEGNVHA